MMIHRNNHSTYKMNNRTSCRDLVSFTFTSLNSQLLVWCYSVVDHLSSLIDWDRDEKPLWPMEFRWSLVDCRIQEPSMSNRYHRPVLQDCTIEDWIVVHWTVVRVWVHGHKCWHVDWWQSCGMDNEMLKMNNPRIEKDNKYKQMFTGWVEDVS